MIDKSGIDRSDFSGLQNDVWVALDLYLRDGNTPLRDPPSPCSIDSLHEHASWRDIELGVLALEAYLGIGTELRTERFDLLRLVRAYCLDPGMRTRMNRLTKARLAEQDRTARR